MTDRRRWARAQPVDANVERQLTDARLRTARARHEYNYGTGEHVLQTVVHELGVLPTEYIREIVTETLAAAAGLTETGTDLNDVAAALRWDRDGRPDRLW